MIKNAYQIQDLETLGIMVHTLKGLSKTLGFEQLHIMAVQLEQSLKGHFQYAELYKFIKELTHYYEGLMWKLSYLFEFEEPLES